jgi:mono/diheme cytochrome c family protein
LKVRHAMTRINRTYYLLLLLAFMVVGWWLFSRPDVPDQVIPESADAVERGQYLVHAAGCISCHEGTEQPGLSGGLALESDFGTFYASNITPDPVSGIGAWTGRDFVLALRHGRTPKGGFYYPAFPYRSYSGMSEGEALDIAAWLMSQPAVTHEPLAHELPVWLRRWQMAFWNRMADAMEGDVSESSDPQIARGAYLSRTLGHCGECHTPRNSLGIVQLNREFAGSVLEGRDVAPIDAAALDGWSENDFALFLVLGLKPDGEFVGGKMDPVIEHNTSQLTEEDRLAMAAFFIRGQ